MKPSWKNLLALLLLVLALPAARAAITCTSISSPGVSINYVPNTTPTVQTYFTVSCTRTSTNDPASVNYSVFANNGDNATGVNNRARRNTAYIRYDVYTNASCGQIWNGGRSITDTITWPAGATGTITRQTSFWGCIVNAQNPTASGVYTDNITLTLLYSGGLLSGAVPVTIYAPALCTLNTAAGNISLTYGAFGVQKSGSTTVRVTCTTGMPYTIDTDVDEAVLNGLRYVLTLNATSANGTGAAQTYTITATIPPGQAGTCATGSCNATRTHTLMISY
jgi:spore coat protein U-like protein